MNERIEELIEQADNIEILPDEEFCDTDFLADIDPRRVKKFAELIVRECAGIAKQTDADDGDDYKSGRQWAGIEILKHFNVGVEE